MSPEDLAAFQAKMARDSADDFVRPPSAPVDDGGTAPTRFSEALGRVRDSGERLAANPSMQALTAVMNPSAGMLNAASGRALEASGIGRRNPTSFLRELEGGPQNVDLQPMAAGPAPAIPVSPTLASTARPTAASVGASFGGAVGPNPMTGLAGAVRQAHANQVGTFDRQKDLVEERGYLQSDRIAHEADMQELAAARQLRDAEVQKRHDAEAMQKHESFLARNEQLANDIGAQKIDPKKVIGDMGAGEKLSYILAGFLSGAAGQGQQVLQRINDQVEQGVRAQMANVDNKKASLGARQNLFSQMLTESGDRRVAEAQTRNLIYESIKQDIAARSARLGIPEVQNNAQILASDIQAKQQDPLLTQIATENLRNAQAAANAAASAQRAAEERAWSRGMQVAELGIKKDASDLERRKFEAESGDQGGLGKAGRQAIALEGAKSQQELDANLAAITNAQKDVKAITAGGSFGNTASELPAWVPGVTGARNDVNTREAYNRRVLMSVGAAYKLSTDSTDPKRKEALDHLIEPYAIKPSDNEEVASAKMASLKKLLSESAAAKGAAPAAPPASLTFTDGNK